MNKSQQGSHALIVLIIVAVVALIGALGWVFISRMNDPDEGTVSVSPQNNDSSANTGTFV